MERQKGLVVERSGRKVTALIRSGELVTFKPARDDLIVGMEVSIPVRGSLFARRRLAPALALSMVLVLISSFGYQQYLFAQPVVAYVTVDSVGSVELEINQAGLVRSATGIDEAGQKALSSVEFKNKPAQEVVAALVKAQDPEKTLEVVVAVVPVPATAGQSAKHVEKAEKAVEKLEKKVVDGASSSAASLTSLRLDPEVRESARQLGISAGRAALWALSRQNTPAENKPGEGGPDEPVVPPAQETPGKGHEEEPGQTGKLGSTPPGQDKKDSILDAIKGALPQVDVEDMTELNEHKDSKDREKFLKDLTKDWIDKVVEQMKDKESKSTTPPGQSKKDDAQPDQTGTGNPSSSQTPADDPDKGKDDHKGTSLEPKDGETTPPVQVSTADRLLNQGKEQHETRSRHSGLPQVWDNFLSRLPWRRK